MAHFAGFVLISPSIFTRICSSPDILYHRYRLRNSYLRRPASAAAKEHSYQPSKGAKYNEVLATQCYVNFPPPLCGGGGADVLLSRTSIVRSIKARKKKKPSATAYLLNNCTHILVRVCQTVVTDGSTDAVFRGRGDGAGPRSTRSKVGGSISSRGQRADRSGGSAVRRTAERSVTADLDVDEAGTVGVTGMKGSTGIFRTYCSFSVGNCFMTAFAVRGTDSRGIAHE